LELLKSQSGTKGATLLGVIDETLTPAGARLLRRRIVAPVLDVQRIRRRLDQVELFVVHSRVRDEFRQAVAGVNDLERLVVRASLGEATPRDLAALRDGLAAARQATSVLTGVGDPSFRDVLGLDGSPDCVEELEERLQRALVERPAVQAKEGAVFRAEYDPELGELDQLRRHGTKRIDKYEEELRQQTRIQILNVRFTRVLGWDIEVSRGQAAKAPKLWRRKQTVAAGERYTTDELDALAEAIETADSRHRERELALLEELVSFTAAHSERVHDLADRVARWDVAAALAEVAHRHDYNRPEVDEGDVLEIHDG